MAFAGAPAKMTADKYSKCAPLYVCASTLRFDLSLIPNPRMSPSHVLRRVLTPPFALSFALPVARFVALLLVVAASMIVSGAWAQAQTASSPNQGGWQGLGKVLDAITPSVDTSIAPSAVEITDHIAELLARGLYPEALDAIATRKAELADSTAPGSDVQLLFLEARALSAAQRHDDAIAIYRRMTEHYPELPEPWNNVAMEYIRLNQPERALQALQMALTADPNYAVAQANLGTVQLMLARQSLQNAAQSGMPDAQAKAQAVERLLDLDGSSASSESSYPPSEQGKHLMSTSPQVILHTNQGDILVELDAANAPKTVENFLAYVRDGFYDGTIFHRVISNFMIQGGGFDVDMQQKPTRAPVQNEADNGLKNVRYTLAMARTSDPHSATAQFFINVSDNDFLNFTAANPQGWGYAVFGKVIEGMDVVETIKGVKTGSRGFHQDVPTEAVIIEKATLVQ